MGRISLKDSWSIESAKVSGCGTEVDADDREDAKEDEVGLFIEGSRDESRESRERIGTYPGDEAEIRPQVRAAGEEVIGGREMSLALLRMGDDGEEGETKLGRGGKGFTGLMELDGM